MKIASITLGLGFLATSAIAAPYYVGENLNPNNNITLGFFDAPTKKDTTAGRGETGNVMALNLKGAYAPAENVSINAGLPFYMAGKNTLATGSESRNALGNANLGAGWTNTMSSDDRVWTYGYNLGADVYMPTSRKVEAAAVISSNPTTDLWRFAPLTTSITPRIGFFASQDMFSAKTNIGYGYSYVQSSSKLPTNDHNRNNINWQTAASWHAMPAMAVNLEYNTMIMDSTTASAAKRKFFHAITPGISGNVENFIGNAYATVPLDTRTRDYTNVAFGLNAGYTF